MSTHEYFAEMAVPSAKPTIGVAMSHVAPAWRCEIVELPEDSTVSQPGTWAFALDTAAPPHSEGWDTGRIMDKSSTAKEG